MTIKTIPPAEAHRLIEMQRQVMIAAGFCGMVRQLALMPWNRRGEWMTQCC